MSDRPKIALVPSVAEWFRDVGISGSASAGRYAAVAEQISTDLETLRRALRRDADVVLSDLVYDVGQIDAVVRLVREADADALIICQMMWTEDPALLALVRALPDMPLALWCHYPNGASSPRMDMPELFARSATVGAFQIAGEIQRLRADVQLIVGSTHNPETLDAVRQTARAAWVRRELRADRYALVPGPYPGMSDLVEDTGEVERVLGCRAERHAVADFVRIAQAVPDAAVTGFMQELARFPRREVSDSQLERGARAALALVSAAEEWRVNGIALDDLHADLHNELGARPCLTPPGYFESGRVYGAEGDLVQTIACRVFGRLTEQPTMFVEVFHADPVADVLVLGHAGTHDLRAADPETVTLVPDYEYECSTSNGAWMEFSLRPGPATLAQMVLGKAGVRLLVAEGELLRLRRKVEGFPSGTMALGGAVEPFVRWAFSARTTHHWVCIPGRHGSQIERLGAALGAEVHRFTSPPAPS